MSEHDTNDHAQLRALGGAPPLGESPRGADRREMVRLREELGLAQIRARQERELRLSCEAALVDRDERLAAATLAAEGASSRAVKAEGEALSLRLDKRRTLKQLAEATARAETAEAERDKALDALDVMSIDCKCPQCGAKLNIQPGPDEIGQWHVLGHAGPVLERMEARAEAAEARAERAEAEVAAVTVLVREAFAEGWRSGRGSYGGGVDRFGTLEREWEVSDAAGTLAAMAAADRALEEVGHG